MKKAFIFFLFVSIFTACTKTKITPINPPTGIEVPPTRAELTKDSIYLYALQTYFWNTSLPSYANFKPRQYASNQAVVNAIKANSPILSGTTRYDKYSFIDEGSVADAIGGVSGDYGFSVFYNGAPSSDLRIKYVYPGSPADLKGLQRGDRITKINGRTDLSSSSDATISAINEALNAGSSINLSLSKLNGSLVDLVINRGAYGINPILFTKTYAVGAKKVGYIVFNSFTSNALPKLEVAFNKFTSDGISELIVDLRYNGGGSVQTAVDFTNLIAPASLNGKTMFTTYFNQTMQSGKADILKNQKLYATGNDGVRRLYSYFDFDYSPTILAGNVENFSKRGSLNGISRVYFLVTNNTASASELLINNLKPVMDVKLIGRLTYGKPVGFFAIHIDKSDLYIPQFQTKNSVNFGDYFGGMAPDVDIADDVTKDFGDVNEKYLAYALNYAEKGNFNLSINKQNLFSSLYPMSQIVEHNLSEELNNNQFKGMVDTKNRFKLKK